jgi:uncharacterized damage-inducible protein DinB
MLDHLRELMGYQEWADAVFFHFWSKAEGMWDDEEMRRRAEHNSFVQEAFRNLILGESVGNWNEGPPPSFLELKNRAHKANALCRDLVAKMEKKDLVDIVKPPWAPDTPHHITIADALVQVAMHTQHHRGQNITRLKQLGGKTANVDWIIWLWKGKPEGRWA